MTIVSSGAISINSLVSEYGGSAPHSLSEYYRGGWLVANHSNNGNVPTSGTISLSNFYGANNQSPTNLTCAGTLASFSPSFNKYGVTRHGAIPSSTNNSSHVPYPAGSITDNTFTNTGGTTTFTLREFYAQLDTIFPNDTTVVIRLTGNYANSTFQAVTGYTNMIVNGVSKPLTSSLGGLTPTGSYRSADNTTIWSGLHFNNTTRWGSSGGFTMSFS